GIIIGTAIGTFGARMVHMTAIPQMVALFNGVGGGAAALVAVAELLHFGVHPAFSLVLPSVLSIVIGSISFAGSMVAFAKLQELIVAGTLVGASGSLLTKLMSDAMGRSLANVLFGAFGQVQHAATAASGAAGRSVRSASAEDLGTLLAYSQRVIIVPGYGLAVAQAQHAARELADVLEKRGVEVEYAIHPVAGRM